MITPALDLQGAPQLIDRIGPETAPADSSGDFGAAFTASLSATGPAADSPASKGPAGDVGQKLSTSNQLGQAGGSGRTVAVKTSSAFGKFVSTAVSPKAGVVTVASLQEGTEGADVDGIQQTIEALASSVGTKSADAALSQRQGSQSTESPSTVWLESQKIALARSEALGKGHNDAEELAGIASQGLDVSGRDTGLTETPKASQSSSKVEASQSEAKSKASGQATDRSASQIALPATGAITNDVLVSSLTVAPTPSQSFSTSSSAPSLKRADGITETSGAASEELSAKFAQQSLTAATGSAGAPKSGALAAWNSVEPVKTSAARTAAGRAREYPITAPQVESAAEAQSSAEAASSASANLSLPSGLLAFSLNRSSAVPISTAFTIEGEQRVSSVPNDLSKDGSRPGSELPGVAPLRSEATNVVPKGSEPVAAASTALLAATAHSDSASAGPKLSKTAGAASGIDNLEATSAKTGTAKSVVSGQPLTGLFATAKQGLELSETQALSQGSAVLPDAASELRYASNASLEQNSPVAPTVTSAATAPLAQRSTAGGAAATEHTKAIGSARTASQPASTPASQSSTDRGVSGDASGNAVSGHSGGGTAMTAADHVATLESLNGAGVSGAAVSAFSVQAVHQGTSNLSGPATVPGLSVRSGQGSLNAVTETELGHPVNTLGAALAAEPHQTLVATPTALEVGVHGGSQGWLKIRAEVGGEGEVSASLAAASPSGEQMLKGQLPALNAYLHSEQMSVTASVAERTGFAHGLVSHEAGGTALQTGGGPANGRDSSLFQGGANQGMEGQGSRSQSDAGRPISLQVTSPSDGQTRYETSFERQVASDSALPSTAADSSGRWLNVRV